VKNSISCRCRVSNPNSQIGCLAPKPIAIPTELSWLLPEICLSHNFPFIRYSSPENAVNKRDALLIPVSSLLPLWNANRFTLSVCAHAVSWFSICIAQSNRNVRCNLLPHAFRTVGKKDSPWPVHIGSATCAYRIPLSKCFTTGKVKGKLKAN
jgi:hypothetical protein